MFLLFISVKHGYRTNHKRSSSSERSISANVPELSQREGRLVSTRHQRERVKKTKKPAVFFNMGRRFKGSVRRALYFEVPSNEYDNQEEDDKSVKVKENNNQGSDEEEADYSD